MRTEVTKQRSRVLVFSIVVSVLSSCGGGTTGTSSVDSVKFAGYAEQSNGSRAPFLSMTVSSGSSGEDLQDSGTNADGDFAMVLPAEESSLVVDVVGVGSATVQRQQQGAGTLSAKLSATSLGLQADSQFEVQINSANLCPNFSASGDELLIVGDEEIAPCPATFAVASRVLSLRDFDGAVVATCGNTVSILDTAQAGTDGQVTLDLSTALTRDCQNITVEISHPQAPGLKSVFSVK